ncbi:MAG: class I SAM-dependent methyltransferase [Thermomicrobiales bacterium]
MSGGEARKARTRDTFNQVAADFDAGGSGCFAHFGRRLVEAAGAAPGQRVLDVATGRGAVLFPAAERVGSTGVAIGIDLAEGMVRATSAEAARRGLTVELRVMDAEQLAFPAARFDRVLCGFGIMFFPDLARALGECRRVLTPGGRLGVATWRAAPSADLMAVPTRLGLVSPAEDVFAEPAYLERILAAAGCGEVRVVAEAAPFRFHDLDQYWRYVRSAGRRPLIDALDAAQTARARALLADRLRPRRREDGWHVEVTALIAVATA